LTARFNENISRLLDLKLQEDYYGSLARLVQYRHKEKLIRELLHHIGDSDRNMLAAEKKKSEMLLQTILPVSMIDELKEKGSVTPTHHENAVVLMTDFVGFTNLARYMSPRELLKKLSVYFDEFERILERYRLEKVKTIGDALLAVGGLQPGNSTATVDSILACIEIIAFVEKQRAEAHALGEEAWGVRCVLHTGSVVSGVVGHTKIAFDVWGFAVNVAARIEAVAPEGKITISEAVYHKVRDFFTCDFLGEEELKGVGQQRIYSVTGFKPRLRQEPMTPYVPNHIFGQLYGHLKAGNPIVYSDGKYRVFRRQKTTALTTTN